MSKIKKSFTLIELVVVVILIGIVYFIVLDNYSIKEDKFLKIEQLYSKMPKNCEFLVFANGKNIELTTNKSFNFTIKNPKIYKLINNNLKRVFLLNYNNDEVIFRYIKHNNIGSNYILQTDNNIYVFTPFNIIKTSNLETAKKLMINKDLWPTDGDYYR